MVLVYGLLSTARIHYNNKIHMVVFLKVKRYSNNVMDRFVMTKFGEYIMVMHGREEEHSSISTKSCLFVNIM